MKVGHRASQYKKMLEAVQNHTPETLIIDEIGTYQEVNEACGISQRGVQLIATTHGRTLADVIMSPQLRNLLGGMNAVILSAGERAAQNAVHKTRLERKTLPCFDVCIELLSTNYFSWRVHRNLTDVVDCVLKGNGEMAKCEIRTFDPKTNKLTITPSLFPDTHDVIPDLKSTLQNYDVTEITNTLNP